MLFTLTMDDAQLRMMWAGAKHYRNVYGGLNGGRNTSKYQTAISCMEMLEEEARRRGVKLDARRDPVR